jgi:hypothetical protein
MQTTRKKILSHIFRKNMTLVVLVFLLEIVKNVLTSWPIVVGCGIANLIQWWTNCSMHFKYGTKNLNVKEHEYEWYHALLHGLIGSWPIIPFASIVPIPMEAGMVIGFFNILIPVLIWEAKELAKWNFPNHEDALFIVEQPIILIFGIAMTISNIFNTWDQRLQPIQPINISWYIFKHAMEGILWTLAIGVSSVIQYYLNPQSHTIFTTIHDRSCHVGNMFVTAIKMYNPWYLIALCQIIVFQDWFDLFWFVSIILLVPVVIWMATDQKDNNRDNLENRLLWILNLYACVWWATMAILPLIITKPNVVKNTTSF